MVIFDFDHNKIGLADKLNDLGASITQKGAIDYSTEPDEETKEEPVVPDEPTD